MTFTHHVYSSIHEHEFTEVDRYSCYRQAYLFFSGSVSVGEWAQVLDSVLRLDLPWRTLRPHLTRLAPDGSVAYLSCFEDMGPGIPLPQVRSEALERNQGHLPKYCP